MYILGYGVAVYFPPASFYPGKNGLGLFPLLASPPPLIMAVVLDDLTIFLPLTFFLPFANISTDNSERRLTIMFYQLHNCQFFPSESLSLQWKNGLLHRSYKFLLTGRFVS